MTTAGLILTALKLILAFLNFAKEKQLIDAGYDKAIAEASAAVLKRTDAGKRIWEQIDAMPRARVDDVLSQLGASDQGG